MNEIFEILHRGHSAFGVFAIDVAVFVAMIVVFYALIYLATDKISGVLYRFGEDSVYEPILDEDEEKAEAGEDEKRVDRIIDSICGISK